VNVLLKGKICTQDSKKLSVKAVDAQSDRRQLIIEKQYSKRNLIKGRRDAAWSEAEAEAMGMAGKVNDMMLMRVG